ncbi:MAG: hypothetical protein PHX01_00990 [Clostridia bacterium]|nr:hypothetical protein [Clostridia bacterium]
MSIKTQEIEKNILVNIDDLIKIILQMSQLQKDDAHRYLPQAEQLINKTNLLLKQLLQKNELPLEQIYRQLITQKLPPPELQKCFGNLEPTLEIIFGLPVFQEHPKTQPRTNLSKTTKVKINLDKFIAALYPQEKILRNYSFRSIKLDYFLPRRKLAILLTPHYYRRSFALNLLILHEGLQLIEISPQELNNPHLLYQKFPRLPVSF